jgi:hypothetical protein
MASFGEDSAMNLDRVAQLVSDGPMPLIRTDFSSDETWQRVVNEVSKEVDIVGDGELYAPNIEAISHPGFRSTTPEALANAWPREHHGYVILADERSMREATSDGELAVVFVDLNASVKDEDEFGWIFGQAFRCVASEVAGIEANLSVANMDFAEFADWAGDSGVFRGF